MPPGTQEKEKETLLLSAADHYTGLLIKYKTVIKYTHLPGSDFDFVVSTIFLISIFTRMKPKEICFIEDNEIKLGPILNCGVKYRWRAKSKL